MGFFKNIVKFIKTASIPTYKFEDNMLIFKIKAEEFYQYNLENYEMKTRHDSYVLEAYTLHNKDIFLEYIRLDNNSQWNGQALSLYEGFMKEKLKIKDIQTIEKKEINSYTFKTYKINNSFILHMIYIYTAVSDIIILDTKGELYKNLLSKLDNDYLYKFENEEKGEINFNISMVKENTIRGFFNASD